MTTRLASVQVPWSLLSDPDPKETLERISGWSWPDDQVRSALDQLREAQTQTGSA
jgi:hypothetical protein